MVRVVGNVGTYKLIVWTIVCILLIYHVQAQNIGVNSTGTTPDNSAGLDVDFSNKGLLIPRVALVSTNNPSPITSPATSLLVYNTATINDVTPGYYYNAGTPAAPQWRKLTTNEDANNWSLTGNSGTIDGTHFIGTTDNRPINFRVNNQKAGRIDSVRNNTSIGYRSLEITSGGGNSAFGSSALRSNTSGSINTATGYFALYFNTIGEYNTANGGNTLYYNTTGNNNTATGRSALYSNTTGSNNTAYGSRSLHANTTGNNNTAYGTFALDENTGYSNTAIGHNALGANTTGFSNVGSGQGALGLNTTGKGNTASGSHSLVSNTTGSNNTGIGDSSLFLNRTGSYNTGIGRKTVVGSFGNTNLVNATAVGAHAQVNTSNSMVLGSVSGVNGATDNTKVGIGVNAPLQALHVRGQVRVDTLLSAAATDSLVAVDANGVLKKRPVIVSGGNLDDAYDFGGAGAGRTIYATDGAVVIEGPTADNTPILSIQGTGDPVSTWNHTAHFMRVNMSNGKRNMIAIGKTTASARNYSYWAYYHTGDGSVQNSIRLGFNNADDILNITAEGRVGIGMTNPSYQLQLSTNSAAKPTSATWDVTSDARLKTNIHDYKDGLSLLQKIRPVYYTYNGKAGMPRETGIGVIAQELQQSAPYMVNEWEYNNQETGETETYLNVNNGAMTYMLINAVKEQQEMIQKLKDENQETVQRLKEENQLLLERLERIEKLLED